jgi:dUTP pyrophosphatase
MRFLVKKVDGLKLPSRANVTDAGYDVIATSVNIVGTEVFKNSGEFSKINYIEYGTSVFLNLDRFYDISHKNIHTLLFPRSSISKTNLVLANSIGLIDAGYVNEIKVRFKYIAQPSDIHILPDGKITYKIDTSSIYKVGDRIAQLVFSNTIDATFNVIESTEWENITTEINRGGGFGSTGK